MSSSRPFTVHRRLCSLAAAAVASALLAAGCGSGGDSSGTSTGSGAGTPVKGGILKAAMADNPDHLDPALAYATQSWDLLSATNNGLVAYDKRVGEGRAPRLVADLAEALPSVSRDGRTYTFRVRRDAMFGPPVDRPVKPSDFKASLERLFRVNSPGLSFFANVEGAREYYDTRRGGVSGIVADDARGTLTFRLLQPDGTFLPILGTPFAYVLPRGAPDRDVSTDKRWRVPTGPYAITDYVPKERITLRRNPDFRSWSATTPDGHLDGVDVAVGTTPQQAANETASGQLDWYFDSVAPDRLAELRARYPKQVSEYTQGNILAFFMNTRRAPMDDVRVRQAINYAIDRDALVKIYGGQGRATENVIPPNFGSYRRHDFYPHDMAKARALVAASGTAGQPIAVWSSNTEPNPKAAQYMADVLDQLGYDASVKTLDQSVFSDTVAAQKTNPRSPSAPGSRTSRRARCSSTCC